MKKYQEILPITRAEAETIFLEKSPKAIALALVRLAYHDADWRRVQDICIDFSTHQDKWVRRTCATCFGHLARIHGTIDRQKVLPVLNQLLKDPEAKGEAEDALEDFAVFIK